ncbi:uncharacterized protein LOC144162783 [Haemaphysalis longicornis]
MPGPNFKRMNRNQKYNFAMRTLQSLADTLPDCQPDIFAQRLRLLGDLDSTWLKGGEEKERDNSTYLATSSDSECDTRAAQNPHVQAVEVGNLQEKAEEPENPGQAVVVENVLENAQEPNNPGQAIAVEIVQEKAEETGKYCAIKLPEVKSRGRPPKRIRQRKMNKKREQEGPMPFQDLSTKSQEILLLTGIADKEAAARVLNEGGILDGSDIVVRPEELPSALLDHRVPLRKVKKYFTAEAWRLLCAQCKKKDDGEIKMISCDQCLEWFHWPCVKVKKEDIKRHWFCIAHTWILPSFHFGRTNTFIQTVWDSLV